MPELPEVEIAARNLRRWTLGRAIAGVAGAGGARLFRPGSPRAAATALAGARFVSVDRRGKNLLLTLDQGGAALGVWSHLGMTGKWLRRDGDNAGDTPRFARISLTLSDGATVHYCDLRLFGRFRLIDGARFAALPELTTLGPDPLTDGIDAAALHQRLERLRAPIKVALLDQTLLAGVGNIQASEALDRARLDPRRPARALTRAEVGRLARGLLASIAFTLHQFDHDGSDEIRYVEEPGTPNRFRVYGHDGARCRRCRRGTIVRIVQAGRSTFFCPACILRPTRD